MHPELSEQVSIEGFIEQRRRVQNFVFLCVVSTILLLLVSILRVIMDVEIKDYDQALKLDSKIDPTKHKSKTL